MAVTSTTPLRHVAVIGAGAWGTALAVTARRAGAEVVLWARRPELVAAIARSHENRDYLRGITLDPAIRVTADLAEAAGAELLLLVVPAQHLRGVARQLAPLLPSDRPLVVCAKGIEQASGALMTDVLAQELPGRPQAVLSGPSFAAEVARGLPTAVTLATGDTALGAVLIATLGSRTFRPYLSDDPLGVEIGGAVKNVVAIACGIVAGRKLGDNARAALITRALSEIVQIGRAKGARPETFMGLSGLGDLLLTCTSAQSRNFSLGQALGEGRTLASVLEGSQSVVEGLYTASAVVAMAREAAIDAPIATAVDAVLNRGADIGATIEALLARPFRAEGV
ncbi:MAG: NAD(P)H-dependent glycerol-3-phosphate dehydrogenase [Kiloniellales bacterium]